MVIKKLNPKFKIFLKVAKALNENNIVPILYGSLGVSRFIAVQNINDIDIVVDDYLLTKDFNKLKLIMTNIRYTQDKLFPHEFIKNKLHVGFESKNLLRRDIKIDFKNIKLTTVNKIKFYELSPSDYLQVYKKTIMLWQKRILKMNSKVKKLENLK